jgi:hypothetical protein
MAAAGKYKIYDLAKFRIGNLTIDLSDGTNWKAALFQSTSNCNTLGVGTGVYGDLTNEVAGVNGYTTGGVAVAGISWTNAAGVETFTFTSPAWSASGGNIVARFLVFYKNATVNTIVKPLLCVVLLDTTPADITIVDGRTTTINTNASGVFTLSGAIVD